MGRSVLGGVDLRGMTGRERLLRRWKKASGEPLRFSATL
jgi:hypothetical protein